MKERLRATKEKYAYFRWHGRRYHRQHLNRQLAAAQCRKDKGAETRILDILQQERD